LQINSTSLDGVLLSLAQSILTDLGNDNDDIAIYEPNPFFNITETSSSVTKSKYLDLVDGGEDNQNIPLYPLIQPARNVDAIMAFDNSADTDFNWPNGSSLVWTYERQFNPQGNGTIFPYVPDTETFLNLNLTGRPTFFGCDASNLTSLFNDSTPESDRFIPPLIIYIANYPHSYYSNMSTFKLSYDPDEVQGMITNGYNIATQNNGTSDSEWPSCLACALIKRELDRQNMSYPDPCSSCYSRYCWNGTVNSSSVSTSALEPSTEIKASSSAQLLPSIIAAVVAIVGSVSHILL
jgi:lysophospholipase